MKSPTQLHSVIKQAMACHSKGDVAGAERILNKLTTRELEVATRALASHLGKPCPI